MYCARLPLGLGRKEELPIKASCLPTKPIVPPYPYIHVRVNRTCTGMSESMLWYAWAFLCHDKFGPLGQGEPGRGTTQQQASGSSTKTKTKTSSKSGR